MKGVTHMNNHKNYTTKKNTHATVRVVLLTVLVVALAAVVSVLVEIWDRRPVEPDVTYPMANANVGWNQTFYAGGWSEGT